MKNKFLKGLVASFALAVTGFANAGIITITNNTGPLVFEEGGSYYVQLDADLTRNDSGEWINGAINGNITGLNANVYLGGWYDGSWCYSCSVQDGYLSFNFIFLDDGIGGTVTGDARISDWTNESYAVDYYQAFSTVFDITVLNKAPTIQTFTGDINVSAGSTVNLSSIATDVAADVLSYEWDLDGDGSFDDFIGSEGTYTFGNAGSFSGALRVSDEDGGFSTRSFNINVAKEVPEPSTLAVFALGLMGLASRKFKKQA